MRLLTRVIGNRKQHEEDEKMFVRSAELELIDRSLFEGEFRNREFHFRVQLLFAEIEPLRGDCSPLLPPLSLFTSCELPHTFILPSTIYHRLQRTADN
jgi:hypothetical protein